MYALNGDDSKSQEVSTQVATTCQRAGGALQGPAQADSARTNDRRRAHERKPPSCLFGKAHRWTLHHNCQLRRTMPT